MKNVIYVNDEITNELCESVRAQIDEALANGVSKIQFRINSPGGSVTSGLALYDLISALGTVETEAYVYGICMSAATYMLVACDKAVATPSASIMIHPCAGGLYGTIKDIEADLEYFCSLQNRVLALYASKTGKTPEEIEDIWEPAKYFSAEEALEFGLIDEVGSALLTNHAPDELCSYKGAPDETETLAETPQNENEGEDKPDEIGSDVGDSGDKSAIFSLKNIVKKCKEIIKRPVVDEYDESAELQNKLDDLVAKYEALEIENKNIKDAMEANSTELNNKLNDLENERTELYHVIEEQKRNIEKTINTEVNNRIAALGYDDEELAEPSNKVEEINIRNIVQTQGLDAALNILVARKNR